MNPHVLLFLLFASGNCQMPETPPNNLDAGRLQTEHAPRDTGAPEKGNLLRDTGKWSYDLEKPTRNLSIDHPRLSEISGLSPSPEAGKLFAIADEAGVVYLLDAQTGSVSRSVSFRLSGDFEGVEWAGKQLYAAKSDGDLFELEHHDADNTNYLVFKTPLKKSQDIEGMCYDSARNALLLVTKGKPESADERQVYAFDLQTKTLVEEPVFSFDPEKIEAVRKKKGKDKNKEDNQYFSPSGIAVHPKTGNWYILSSAKRRLAIIDAKQNQIIAVEKLDKDIFPQPEGICFDVDGTLYISSEGKGGQGRLLTFEPLR